MKRVSQIVDQLPKQNGLIPYYISTDSGQFKQTTLTLGARADSYYECARTLIPAYFPPWCIRTMAMVHTMARHDNTHDLDDSLPILPLTAPPSSSRGPPA